MPRVISVVAGGALVMLLLAPAASARPLDNLGGRLRAMAEGKRVRARPASAPSVQAPPVTVRGGSVLVDVYVTGAMRDGAAALRDEGMRVEAVSGRSPERMVEGWVPVSALDDVATLRRTKGVEPVYDAIFNTGGTLSQGDAAHRGPQGRALGPTGAGVPVGIVSDSINKVGSGVAGSQATGDLPPTVQILDDPASGTDEGRAMAEIVYDTAPGIPKIMFSRGGGGAAIRVNSIDALVAGGAKVIADDTTYLSEPFFQDGIVAQAADRAKANGTAYVVTAGNRGRMSWEGTFTPAVSSPTLNDFDAGAGVDTRQTLTTIPAGKKLSVFVQWDEPFGAATSDFALDFFAEPSGTSLGTVDSGGANPAETAGITAGATSLTVSMTIRRVSGTGAPRLKWIANAENFTPPGNVPVEFNTSSQAIDPDGASARGSITVAAVNHADPGLNDVESFSSRGPSVSRFRDTTGAPLATPDVRPKPDVAGADGVNTSIAPAFAPFFGTSAAAPAVAGVVALLRSANPALTVDQVSAILRDPRGSIDCTAPGFPDADCGSGFVLADAKLAMALDTSPPAVAATLSPPAPDGANGWYHSPVGLTWSVSDPDSPVSTSGCDPQSVATDGVVGVTCTAVSPGGTTSVPVTIKRDATPPSSPTFTGIAPGATFTTLKVPAAGSIGCKAIDATSGVTSCVVTGYSAALGPHILTATATDESGLASSATLTYTVTRLPAAVKSLQLSSRQTIASILRGGFTCTLDVAADATRLVATLKVGNTTVGTLKVTKKRGKATLRIKLSKAGKKKLRGLRKAKFALTVAASSPNATATKLGVSRRLNR